MHFLILLLLLGGAGETVALSSSPTPNAVASSGSQSTATSDSIYSVVSTRYTYDWISERQSWHRREATLQAHFPRGVLVTTIAQQRRFGRNEVSGKVHYWTDLREDSYGHVHVSLAPNARTMPHYSLGGEIYEVIGGWEFSGWYEWRRYYNADVHVMGPQIAWYVGDWYLRTRTSIIERDDNWNLTQILAARRYLGSERAYLDGQVGFGRTIDLLQPDLPLQRSRGYFASVRLRKFVTSTLGLTMGGRYSTDILQRAGVSMGLLARW